MTHVPAREGRARARARAKSDAHGGYGQTTAQPPIRQTPTGAQPTHLLNNDFKGETKRTSGRVRSSAVECGRYEGACDREKERGRVRAVRVSAVWTGCNLSVEIALHSSRIVYQRNPYSTTVVAPDPAPLTCTCCCCSICAISASDGRGWRHSCLLQTVRCGQLMFAQ